jgi:type II secretory pathway pseudopilin PulG
MKRTDRRRTPPAAGFTLVESLMAVTFLAILFLMVAHTSSRASDAYDEGSLDHQLTTEAHRGLERITAALELASRADMGAAADPALGADVLSFRTPTGFAGGAIQWGPLTTIAFELETGELDNGADDDGDGYVDEGRVVWSEDDGLGTTRRVVLAPRVAGRLAGETSNGSDDNGNGLIDERGLAFVFDNPVLTVYLTCQRRDESGRVLTKTVETAIRVRN